MKYIPIAAASNGVNVLVAPVPAKKIRVVNYLLSFSGTVNAKFQSSAGPTDLTGLFYGTVGVVIPGAYAIEEKFSGMAGLFESLPGEGLNLNLSGAVAVGGYLVYQEVT